MRDLVPVLNWLALRGRCRHCGRPIGWGLLAIEIAAVAVALRAAAVLPGWLAFAGAGFGWTLLTLPLATAGLLLAWGIDPWLIVDHQIGAAAGFAAFAVIAALYRLIRRRDGLGDARLLAALGAWVSWQGLPTIVLYAAGTPLARVLLRSLRGTPPSAKQRLPFGPLPPPRRLARMALRAAHARLTPFTGRPQPKPTLARSARGVHAPPITPCQTTSGTGPRIASP